MDQNPIIISQAKPNGHSVGIYIYSTLTVKTLILIYNVIEHGKKKDRYQIDLSMNEPEQVRI